MSRKLVLKGNLIKGLGEGRYYMKRQGYKKQFQNLLDYTPWPGTLNIKLKSPKKISNPKFITIKGFKEKNRSFGKIKCYPCKILNTEKDIVTHLIIPKRTSHDKNIIEIISPVNLRKTLNLKEKEVISIIVE